MIQPMANTRQRQQQDAQTRRFATYRQLRANGLHAADAARAIGVCSETGGRYERAYREASGLPRRESGYTDPRPPGWTQFGVTP